MGEASSSAGATSGFNATGGTITNAPPASKAWIIIVVALVLVAVVFLKWRKK